MASLFRNLFKEAGAKDVITLFHAPSAPASIRVLTLLKQHNANAVATATEDQASDHSTQSKIERSEFQLDVTEEAPTSDQLKSILEYVGAENAGSIVKGAIGVTDAVKKVQQDNRTFQRPLTVDWNTGRAVVGEDESKILSLLKQVTKE